MAIVKSKKKKEDQPKPAIKSFNEPVADDAMERLVRLMNDSPSLVKLKGTEWEIRSLRPGTQWLIAEEACKIVKKEGMAAGDVLKEFATELPSVCRVLTLALLNDKERIYGDEYGQVYDTLLWGSYEVRDWATLLLEVVQMIDVDFFFVSTGVIETLRRSTLERKMTMKELKLSSPAPSGGR